MEVVARDVIILVGVLALTNKIPEAAALADFMEDSIISQSTITLSAIDEPNLVPMFNCYVWAASLYASSKVGSTDKVLPAIQNKSFQKKFSDSGLIIDRGERHYSIIAAKKGGVAYHFFDNKLKILDTGVVIRNKAGYLGSSQTLSRYEMGPNYKEIIIYSPIIKMPKGWPTPYQFIILRLLSISLFLIPSVREFIKRSLVKFLITRRKSWPCSNKRTIDLGQNLSIKDEN